MPAKVLLVSMPWNRPDYPSIQIGRLKSFLMSKGIECQAYYPYIDLSDILEWNLYVYICETLNEIVAEGFFASIYFDHLSTIFLEECHRESGLDVEIIQIIWDACVNFLNTVFLEIYWNNFTHIGFTCTFCQTWASLCLARMIKTRYPSIRIIFGGHAVSGENGPALLNNFSCIDYIVSGPGEDVLIDLLQYTNVERHCIPGKSPLLEHLLISPNYEEYFTRIRKCKGEFIPTAIMAASTGCDYGKCTFCVLNSSDHYLAISPDRLFEIARSLVTKYQVERIEFADTSLTSFFSATDLSDRLQTLGVELYGEVRAVLDETRIQSLKKAGFSGVQIGIESFNTEILKKMKKPADLIQNIYNLKLCYELELEVSYNIILDFPGTEAHHIQSMISLLPKIHHLPPPTSLSKFILFKGSPVYCNHEEYGIHSLFPSHLYPVCFGDHYGKQWPHSQFDYNSSSPPPEHLFHQFDSFCAEWAALYNPAYSLLSSTALDGQVHLIDNRKKKPESYHLALLPSQCLTYCDRPRSIEGVVAKFGREVITYLETKDLLLIDNGKALSLPVTNRKRNLNPAERPGSVFSNITTHP